MTTARFLLGGLCLLAIGGCIPMLVHEAETPRTRGVVLDGVSGEPVAGARVVLADPGHSAREPRLVSDVSDDEGRFRLDEKSRRYLTLVMPGSYLARFPLQANHQDYEHAAHGIALMGSRTRAGTTDVRTVLLMLPPATDTLPAACDGLEHFQYAFNLVQRLPAWREQGWFRHHVLQDPDVRRNLFGGVSQMLAHANPQCINAADVKQRREAAWDMLEAFN